MVWQLGIIPLLIVGFGLAITGTVVVFTIEFGDDDNLGLALIHILVGPCALLGSMVWWILWFPEKVLSAQTNTAQTHDRLPHNSLISLNSIPTTHLLAP